MSLRRTSVAEIMEGDEWTDGQFNYIAYRKADGTMVIRDVEGFDYSVKEWSDEIVSDGSIRPVNDVERDERIKRWEGEVGVLPRA